ncbi:MAG: glutamate 5-kinase [Planctomycetota bacterium]
MADRRVIVVKVGSGVVAPGGALDRERLTLLALDIAEAVRGGSRVVVVSSGAVAAGLADLGLDAMPTAIVQKQAAAAVGQSRLVGAWARAFEPFGVSVAQVLLTADDLDHRSRFLNARRTLETLLDAGVVPIVNENDSVAFDEIRFGDNDRLSALVAGLLDADLLLLLSVVEGVLDASGAVVPELADPGEARGYVRDERSATGIGGMVTKLDAASVASSAGAETVIAFGARRGVVASVLAGDRIGTRIPAAVGMSAKKRWIASAARPRGTVVVDGGAASALAAGASLLPAGIARVEGDFRAGDLVSVVGSDGAEIARGLAGYSSVDARVIAGKKSGEIAQTLGYIYAEEMIHRNDMHVFETSGAGDE